ncbi:hypothetical protein WNY37_17945 [Henriciella sp. AS95]|uniref:hypothetical protein n=1 Tax=Henriciella sp. AS95 TaxID=3135782 RepID=UPI00317F38FA
MGPVDLTLSNASAKTPATGPSAPAKEDAHADISKRFEQMLWAEMLRHTGLEDALTKSGGQGTEAFTQFVIEAIAEDMAEQHPLGLNPIPEAAEAYARLDAQGKK